MWPHSVSAITRPSYIILHKLYRTLCYYSNISIRFQVIFCGCSNGREFINQQIDKYPSHVDRRKNMFFRLLFFNSAMLLFHASQISSNDSRNCCHFHLATDFFYFSIFVFLLLVSFHLISSSVPSCQHVTYK